MPGKVSRAWLLIAIPLLLAARSVQPAEAPFEITIVQNSNGPEYAAVVAGFEQRLAEAGFESRIALTTLEPHTAEAESALAKHTGAASGLVLSIGSEAIRFAEERVHATPIVAALALRIDEPERPQNVTGILVGFPPELELEWLHRLAPNAKRIGVIFNPRLTERYVARARTAAKRLNLELIERRVNEPSDLPKALAEISDRAQIMWGFVDESVYTPQTARSLLVFSFRNRIPLTGLSSAWVKAGSLFSLERDYNDVGAQAAELALKIAGGVSPSSLPPQTPRKAGYVLNRRTAEHMKLELPEGMIDGADRTFE